MSLHLQPPTSGVSAISPPRITVIGVGGGGGNAVDNMIATATSRSEELSSVEFIVANTDAQQLSVSQAKKRLQLGPALTRGLGAGARPDIGRKAAEEVESELKDCLKGVDLVFITAGMGGGTGTGAAPVIARIAREGGALTIGVVSKPFKFEGIKRSRAAEEGIAELQKHVDTLIVIPNQNLFHCANQTTTLDEAFKMADEVLHRGVRSITDTMIIPGKINLDFADVTTVMKEKGKAMIGTGWADSNEEDNPDWAIAAAERAITNPLLEETSINGASGLLVNVTGGTDLGLHEYTQIMERIGKEAHPDAEVISGLLQSEEMNGKVQISVVATGLLPANAHDQHRAEDKNHTSSSERRNNEKNNFTPKSDSPDLTQSATRFETASPQQEELNTARPQQTAQHPQNTVPDYAQRTTTPPQNSTSVPNYHLDPRPTTPTQQHYGHQQPSTPPLTAQRPPYPEETQAAPKKGFFSNFFRSPPPQEAPATSSPSQQRQTQQIYTPTHPYHDEARSQTESELDVPAYLRRNNPPS